MHPMQTTISSFHHYCIIPPTNCSRLIIFIIALIPEYHSILTSKMSAIAYQAPQFHKNISLAHVKKKVDLEVHHESC